MSFADPQVVTVNAVAKSMGRVETNGTSSRYSNLDQTYGLKMVHSGFKKDKKSRIKHLIAFKNKKIVADPITSLNDTEEIEFSVQINRPEAGWTDVEIFQHLSGLFANFTQANVTKIVGMES